MPDASAPKIKRDWRTALRTIHRWVGLVACLPLALQAATGCILMVKQNWMDLPPPARLAPLEAGVSAKLHKPSEILAAAEDYARAHAAPGAHPAVTALIMRSPAQPVFARMQDGFLMVDPRSLKVSERYDPLHPVLDWHRQLLMPSGGPIVGCYGLVLMLLGVTGVILWWPRGGAWRQAFTIPRRRSAWRRNGGHAGWRGLHLVLGGSTALMAMLVAATGFCLAFDLPTGGGAVPAADDPALSLTADAPLPLSLDDAVALAQQAAPGTRWRLITLPRRPGGPLRIDMAPGGHDTGAAAIITTLGIDTSSGHIVSVAHRPAEGGAMSARQAIHTIHSGNGAWLAWQIVLLAYGLVLFALSTSGLVMRIVRPTAGSTSRPSMSTTTRSTTDA